MERSQEQIFHSYGVLEARRRVRHTASLILHARAKVNLHLDVGPRRSDGYHSLDTTFQEISLADTLTAKLTDGPIKLTVQPKAKIPTDSRNLVVRALESLRAELKGKKGMRVHLVKRIPMGAGLGGGSADAAAALWAGWILWTKGAKSKRVPRILFKCARKLGADVPFFLRGGKARGRGIGDKLTPLKAGKKRWMILIYPRIHVSTAEAYGSLDQARLSSPWSASTRKMDPGLKHARMTKCFNSFEPVILKKYPKIAAAKQALWDAGCTGVMMSGSGSTVFGFASSQAQGRRALRILRRKPWDVFLVST